MKRYEKHFKEAKEYTADLLIAEINNVMKKHFPKSNSYAKLKTSLGSDIFIYFTVGAIGEQTNGIDDNDISMTKAFIWDIPAEGVIKNRLEFSPSQGGSIKVKPEEGSFYAFDKIKVGLRKKTGTPEQIVKHLDTYFAKLKKTIKDNLDRIPDKDLEYVKGKI